MALLCIDASVLVAWVVPDRRSAAVEEAWRPYLDGDDQFIGPPALHVEAVSAIRRLASRGLLSEEEATGIVSDLLELEIEVQDSADLYRRAYKMAARYGRSTVYDTCYLALAESSSCELITLDQRLYNAAVRDFPSIRLL